ITEVIDRGKGLVVAVNKWDAIKKDDGTMGEWVTRLRAELKVLEHTPLVFVSVNHNQRLRKVLQVAIDVHKERSRKLSTTELNRFLADATGYLPPPAVQGKRIAINYVTQVHRAPPVFAFFTNHPDLIPETYRRYIENRLREKFGFTGVALRVSFRQK
ncbi:MAG: ribosome biogenesis GTPase Der, partial [Desulfuromonadales bacterium]|nr:ribosome biogenesis GTPase Der [Desulfuromonadales bacterium]